MSYTGEQEIIPCDRGGLSANPNIDATPAVQMINPSRNINLQKSNRSHRGGTSIVQAQDSSVSETYATNLGSWTTVSGTPSIVDAKLRIGSNDAGGGTQASMTNDNTISGDFELVAKIYIDPLAQWQSGYDFLNLAVGVGNAYVNYKVITNPYQYEFTIQASSAISSSVIDLGSDDVSRYIKIQRVGSTTTAYYGLDGVAYTELASTSVALSEEVAQLIVSGNHDNALQDIVYGWLEEFNLSADSITTINNIRGIYDYMLKTGTQYLVTADSTGALYKDSENQITSNLSKNNFFSFVTFDGIMFLADGETLPKTWEGGLSVSAITSPADDWISSIQPSQLVVHGRGQSERLWAIMGGTSQYNHCVYASKDGDGNDFSAGSVVKFEIQTNDNYGIVGAVEYGDRLVCFGKRKAYIIDDTDTSQLNWGYQAAQWEGGVAHWRLIVKTPNDVVCMMEDGEIFSVTSAENYGDYKAASLTRPAHIDRWIKDNVDLSKINQFHAIYDPSVRAIKYFMVRSGQTQVDMALCYFIDREPQEAWIVHDNSDYDSGYNAASAGLVRKAIGDYKVYTGDYYGRVWELETNNKNDNSNGYYAGFRTPAINCGGLRTTKNFKRLWVSVRPTGAWDLEVKWWVDGKNLIEDSLDLTPDAGLGSFILGTDVLGGLEVKDVVLDLGQNGRRVQFECYNENANQGFFVNQLMIDHRPLGNEPR